MDAAGTDGTGNSFPLTFIDFKEFFLDVGHSSEARDMLKDYYVGDLKK